MSRAPELPERPYLPESLYALAVTIATARIVLWLLPWTDIPLAPLLVAASAIAVFAFVLWRLERHVAALLVLCFAATFAASSIAAARLVDARVRVLGAPASALEFVAAGDPSKTDSGYRVRAVARMEGHAVGDVWLTSRARIEAGERVCCIGRVKALEDDEYGRRTLAQGIVAKVSAVRIEGRLPPEGIAGLVGRLRAHAAEAMGGGGAAGALVRASVLGLRDGVQQDGMRELFAAAGVSHLVAVSGGHLAVIAAALSGLLSSVRMAPKARMALLLAGTGAFVLFCGAPISAVRAWLMSGIGAASQLMGRRSHGISSVSAVALCMVWMDPCTASDIGFLLSVSAVLGLCILSGYLAYALDVLVPNIPWLRGVPPALMRAIRSGERTIRSMLAATLAAQTATAAFSLSVFGTFSLVAPLANLAMAGPFAVLVSCGMGAALASGIAPVCHVFLAVADGAAAVALVLLRALARLPYASLSCAVSGPWAELAAAAALLVWVAWWPPIPVRPVRIVATGALAALCSLFISLRFFAPARLVVLDVGQGDAILLQDGASAVLVDAGNAGTLAPALAREHVFHLDAVVLTHLHADHTGGLEDLAGRVGVDRVLVAEGAAEAMPAQLADTVEEVSGKPAEEISCGTTMQAGGFALEVLWPRTGVTGEENADSIQLLCEYRGRRHLRALLTGDGEEDTLREIVEEVGDIDVLKAGHHGSAVSIAPDEAAILKPELAIASAGANNRYGHPDPACVETLEEAGAVFICTKDAGSVTVVPGTEGCTVYTDRPIRHNSGE